MCVALPSLLFLFEFTRFRPAEIAGGVFTRRTIPDVRRFPRSAFRTSEYGILDYVGLSIPAATARDATRDVQNIYNKRERARARNLIKNLFPGIDTILN